MRERPHSPTFFFCRSPQELQQEVLHNIKSYAANKSTKQFYNMWAVYGGVGVGKSRTGVEMFKCFKEFEKQELQLQTGKAISFNSLFAHRVHLFMDFQRGDTVEMAEQRLFDEGKLDAPAILGARIASHFFIGEVCRAIESFFRVPGISRSIFSLPGVLREMGKLQKIFYMFPYSYILYCYNISKASARQQTPPCTAAVG